MSAPATFVRHWFVRLQGNEIVCDATLDGATAAGTMVECALPALSWKASGQVDANGKARFSAPAPANLIRWSPESPTLYDVVVAAGEDRQRDRVGFRTISVEGKQVLLNDRPVFLSGISMHEEPIGASGGRVVRDREARALLQVAKNMNCNFVRLAHYPHSEAMLRAADAMGVLVWAEVPVYWEDVSYASTKTLSLAQTMFTEMIERDANRASVVMWSVANETPENTTRFNFLRAVVTHVKALDPSRLVTAALNKNADVGGTLDGQKRFIIDDPLGAYLDVIGFNQYEAWYSQITPAQLKDVSFSCPYDKPLIVSEFGADALAGHRADKRARWSEDFQAWLYTETLAMIDRIPGVVGITPWVLKDFRTPRRWHGRFQQNWNRKGMISPEGKPKLAFTALRNYYQKKHIKK